MNKNVQIISKGLYNGTQDQASPMHVREYVFAREKGKKCLLLRFVNNSDVPLTGIEFKLIQKNSDGVKIDESKLSLKDFDCRPGELFSPSVCFFVNEKCIDFDIKIISILSGDYEYRSKNGEYNVSYPIVKKNNRHSNSKGALSQRSRLNGKVKFSVAILIFALLLIAFALIWPFYNNEIRPVIERAIKEAWEMIIELVKRLFLLIGDLFERLLEAIEEYTRDKNEVVR